MTGNNIHKYRLYDKTQKKKRKRQRRKVEWIEKKKT